MGYFDNNPVHHLLESKESKGIGIHGNIKKNS